MYTVSGEYLCESETNGTGDKRLIVRETTTVSTVCGILKGCGKSIVSSQQVPQLFTDHEYRE